MLGIKFDSYAGESFYNDKMQPVIDELREKGLMVEDQGAQVVRLDDYGMPPAIILRSDGASLYVTRDLAAAKYRHDTYHFDRALYVVAYQQDLHFKQLFKVMELLGWDWGKGCEHVNFGMVSYEGKSLSTREGHIVYLDDLLTQSVEKAKAIIEEKSPELENKDEVSKAIGIGSVIFFTLYNGRIKDIDFNWDRALNFDGETGAYVMYTHARCASVLRKAGESGDKCDYSALSDAEAQTVISLIDSFPGVIRKAIEKSEPYMVTRFVCELAKAFNKFYYERHIIVDDPGERAARVALTKAAKQTIATALKLLNISAPEQM